MRFLDDVFRQAAADASNSNSVHQGVDFRNFGFASAAGHVDGTANGGTTSSVEGGHRPTLDPNADESTGIAYDESDE